MRKFCSIWWNGNHTLSPISTTLRCVICIRCVCWYTVKFVYLWIYKLFCNCLGKLDIFRVIHHIPSQNRHIELEILKTYISIIPILTSRTTTFHKEVGVAQLVGLLLWLLWPLTLSFVSIDQNIRRGYNF